MCILINIRLYMQVRLYISDEWLYTRQDPDKRIRVLTSEIYRNFDKHCELKCWYNNYCSKLLSSTLKAEILFALNYILLYISTDGDTINIVLKCFYMLIIRLRRILVCGLLERINKISVSVCVFFVRLCACTSKRKRMKLTA